MAQTVQNMPSGFLSNLEVTRQRSGCHAFLVIYNQPDRHKPLAQRQFGVVKNGAYFDREALAAIATLEGFQFRELIDAHSAAVRTELAVTPADRPKSVKARLLVSKRFEEAIEAIKIGEHGVISLDNTNTGSNCTWVKHVYRSQHFEPE